MSADRELLEMAAKAVGLTAPALTRNSPGLVGWNPLTDDGDALRLAVKLRMPITFDDHATMCNFDKSGWRVETGIDDLGGFAATRRAIVRAAAEIGRAMP